MGSSVALPFLRPSHQVPGKRWAVAVMRARFPVLEPTCWTLSQLLCVSGGTLGPSRFPHQDAPGLSIPKQGPREAERRVPRISVGMT